MSREAENESRAPFVAGRDGELSLADCLVYHCQEEVLAGREAFHCAKCGMSVEANKSVRLTQLPELLLIEIKRFRKGQYTGWISKVGEFVQFPLELDLGPHLARHDDDTKPEAPSRTKYQCCGVVNHHGSYGGGHYTAYVRDPLSGKLFHCDDEQVQEAEPESMLESEAYVLLYRRCG